MSDEESPLPPPPRSPTPVAWVLLGMVATLGAVYILRRTEPDPRPPAANPTPATTTLGDPAPAALGSARAHFAELYTGYLLRTYYVPERGFCKPLLKRICDALRRSQLLPGRDPCREPLPHDRFILGIGRFQHASGLPVDGKAGPDTVRLMLGGNFRGRRGMAALYCPRGAFSDPGPEGTVASPLPSIAPF
ncbi:MAG: peptidoglycan-binding domain-containing protein [Myxococcota bacterium]